MRWPDRFPELETERLRITIPEASYAPQVRAYFEDNREHLEPWGPPIRARARAGPKDPKKAGRGERARFARFS
ncbi:MAG: hypothetical protein R3B99_33775 [Polyangiales bacterium]